MVKGQPFNVRLQEETERLVEAEARRTRRTKSAVVEAFTEETARTRRFPGIAFRGDDARRRAWVIGSGLDVWEIFICGTTSAPLRRSRPTCRCPLRTFVSPLRIEPSIQMRSTRPSLTTPAL